MTEKVIVRKGNPLKKKSLEAMVTSGLSETTSLGRKGGRLHAGDAAICTRRNVLNGMIDEIEEDGIEVPFTAASSLYTSVGDAFHKKVRDALYKKRALLFSELKLPDIGLNLGGYIDAIVLVEGTIRLLEIKSCGALPPDVKFAHRKQALVYSIVSGLPATVLYASRRVADFKGQLMIKQFDIQSTFEERKEILKTIAMSYLSFLSKKVPPVPFATDKICTDVYCPYIEYCWNEKSSVVKPFEMTESEFKIIENINSGSLVDRIFETTKPRRNGILKHIARNGNEIASEVLSGSWDEVLEFVPGE